MYMHMMYIHPAAFSFFFSGRIGVGKQRDGTPLPCCYFSNFVFFRADRSWRAERWYTAALLLFPAALLRVDCEGPVDGLTDGPPWSHGLWKGLSPYCLLCTVRRSCLLGTLRCSSYFCFFIYFTLNFFWAHSGARGRCLWVQGYKYICIYIYMHMHIYTHICIYMHVYRV